VRASLRLSPSVAPLVRSFVAILARIGAAPDDPEAVRVQKAFLVATAILILPAGVVWGVIYIALGELVAAAIPLSYVVVSAASIVVFARTRSLAFLRTTQLGIILVSPFLLMVSLGGFVPSSAVILWSLLAPMGAIVVDDRRRLPDWIAAYIVLVAVGGPLGASVRSGNDLPGWLVQTLFALNVGTVSFIAFVLLATFARQREQAIGLARSEQERADGLLLDILPRSIAEALKGGRRRIADRLDLLESVGVPEPDPDHARSVARMALAMRDSAEARELLGTAGRLRIGINTGPVVAGVIGRKRPIYDLWGDAVNVASRMESQGEPGRIQVTRATYELLRDGFLLEPRGTVNVKGRGEMETWYLLGERTAGGAVSSGAAHPLPGEVGA